MRMPTPLFEPLHPVQKAAFQKMSDETKLEILQSLISTSRALKKAQYKTLHPEWSEEKMAAEMKRIFLHVAT